MTSLNNAQYTSTLEGKLVQINDLYQDDRVMIGKDETPIIKIHESFAHIYCNPTALANSIDTSKSPCDYQDVMSWDQQEWAAAYMKEHKEFHEQDTLTVA
jgi:hypothetical protein